jgi:hypothetical protein
MNKIAFRFWRVSCRSVRLFMKKFLTTKRHIEYALRSYHFSCRAAQRSETEFGGGNNLQRCNIFPWFAGQQC